MTAWARFARKCERDYGTFVDRDERFFLCPECGEPIYESDWRDSDFVSNDGYICPICEFIL